MNTKKSLTQETNFSTTSQAESNLTQNDSLKIVQCPACQTTFAVQAATLEGLSHPRFHCSRCDNVFSVELDLVEQKSTVDTEIDEQLSNYFNEPEDIESPNPIEDPELDPDNYRNSTYSAPFDYEITDNYETETPSHGWTIGDALTKSVAAIVRQKTNHTDFPEPTSSSNLSALMTSNDRDSQTVTSDSSVQLKNFSSWSENSLVVNPKTNSDLNEPRAQMDLLLNPGFRRKKQADFDYNRLNFNKLKSSTENDPATQDTPEQSPFFNSEVSTAQPAEVKADPVIKRDSKRESVKPKKRKTPDLGLRQLKLWDSTGQSWTKDASAVRQISKWSSLIVACSPIVFCLSLLALGGYLLTKSPKTAFAIGATLSDSMPQVAPTSLVLQNTSHKIVNLESGEQVHVITGEVRNRGSRDFSEVTIQSLLFSAKGKLVVEKRVPLANSLTRARVASLSWEMIDRLQETPQNRRFSLEPGQTSAFALAINSSSAAGARHVSSRIYSAR